jgi:hypothetical protein
VSAQPVQAWDGNPLRVPWRVGRKVGRTIYAAPFPDRPSEHDPLVGMMDTPELAEAAVRAHNDALEARGERHPWQLGCATCQHEAETTLARLRQGLEAAEGEAYLGALQGEPDPLAACHNVIRVCQEALRA